MDGLSAHADYEEMLDWLSYIKKPPKKVFLVHGEEEASYSMASKIQNQLHWNVHVPTYNETVDLS